ncbi:hypothetical protein BN946_scf184905.g6 [Trametes cinnabarina]|uniref:Uncharacterized protein n=1 Tax=Pycnoporus cinnabarinus TaxID=5643 RepID=A0A060SD34_PYCCI|nr:hypothetical protein BN946_scf184905.g6 [Trametes cinnabarina]
MARPVAIRQANVSLETLEVLLADPDATRELWVYAAQRAILEVGFANELYTGGPEITELRARAERLLANPRFGGDLAERFRTSMLESDCDRLHDIAFEKLATVRKLRSEARTVRIALRHSATAATLVALDRLFALLDEVEVKARDDLAAVDATWARLHPNGPEVIELTLSMRKGHPLRLRGPRRLSAMQRGAKDGWRRCSHFAGDDAGPSQCLSTCSHCNLSARVRAGSVARPMRSLARAPIVVARANNSSRGR